MAQNLFSQNIVAIIWDFDKTLIPGYMQEPLFRRYGVDAATFWDEVGGLSDYHKRNGLELVSKDTLYLNHILTYVRSDVFKGLSNKLLRQLGAEIDFYAGLPDFFSALRRSVTENGRYRKYDIEVEHYIVSTGLRQMILGSKIAPFVDGVWACEFVEKVPPPGYLERLADLSLPDQGTIVDIGYALDNTTKTRAVFEINKGTNKRPEIDVNASIKQEDRRVPFHNMIYIADGPSDIPVFSILDRSGGRTYAVYKKGSRGEFAQVKRLQEQSRVQSFGEADYTPGSQTAMWISIAVEEIADRIVGDHERALGERVGIPPGHIIQRDKSAGRTLLSNAG